VTKEPLSLTSHVSIGVDPVSNTALIFNSSGGRGGRSVIATKS